MLHMLYRGSGYHRNHSAPLLPPPDPESLHSINTRVFFNQKAEGKNMLGFEQKFSVTAYAPQD